MISRYYFTVSFIRPYTDLRTFLLGNEESYEYKKVKHQEKYKHIMLYVQSLSNCDFLASNVCLIKTHSICTIYS